MDDTRPQLQPFDDSARLRVLAKLRELSIQHGEHRWVAQLQVKKVMAPYMRDRGTGCIKDWRKRGLVRHQTIQLSPGVMTVHGQVALLHLNDLSERLELYRPRPYTKWTQAMRDTLAEDYGRRSPKHIAKKLGVTIGAVCGQARLMGLTFESSNAGWSLQTVALFLGVPYDRVRTWRRRGMATAQPHLRKYTPIVVEPEAVLDFLNKHPRTKQSLPAASFARLERLVVGRVQFAPEGYRGKRRAA